MGPFESYRRSRGLGLPMLLLIIAAVGVAYLVIGALGGANKRVDASGTSAASFAKVNEALVRFVMLYKRLPCPADGLAHTGKEDPQPSMTDFSQGTTACNSPSGVVPWAVLNLSQTDALDPWGRYISYRVYDSASGFTRSGGLNASNCINESTLTGYSTGACATTHENTVGDFLVGKGITVNDLGTAKSDIAYALISMGSTGYGAYYPGATAPMTMPTGASKEFLNAGAAGTYWILTASSPDVAANDASHFDDALSYTTAFNLTNTARAARPWALQITTGTTTVSTVLNIATNNPYKITTDTASAHGAVTVTAAADLATMLCTVTNGSFDGIAPCLVGGGADQLTTLNNEKLTFDFKVRRAVAMIRLQGMQHTGSSDEQAQFTFYDSGGTQVAQVTKISCHTGSGAYGQYLITPGAEFTKVEVKALNKTSGGSSDFAVAAIAACYPSGATCQVPSYSSADDCP